MCASSAAPSCSMAALSSPMEGGNTKLLKQSPDVGRGDDGTLLLTVLGLKLDKKLGLKLDDELSFGGEGVDIRFVSLTQKLARYESGQHPCKYEVCREMDAGIGIISECCITTQRVRHRSTHPHTHIYIYIFI